MVADITLGQYFPGESAIHRLDPRTKILLLLLFILLLFGFSSQMHYLLFTAVTAALILSSRIPLRLFFFSIRPLRWILIFTFLIHLFTTPGQAIFEFGFFELTREGLEKGIFISLRLILLILLSSLLTFTTSPLKLTDGLERLLSPLRPLGVPAHELAMMMTIALRFVPTLLEETDRILKAQKSRGADFSEGNLLKRMKAFVPIMVPLFLSAFRRAEDLAMAMEARCYRGGVGRTQMKQLAFSSRDSIAAGSGAVFLAVLLGMKYFGGMA